MSETPHKFWMVYGVGQNSPKARHKTRESAVAEAKRLARTNFDVEFYVLESMAQVVKRDVDVTLIDSDPASRPMADSDIPF